MRSWSSARRCFLARDSTCRRLTPCSSLDRSPSTASSSSAQGGWYEAYEARKLPKSTTTTTWQHPSGRVVATPHARLPGPRLRNGRPTKGLKGSVRCGWVLFGAGHPFASCARSEDGPMLDDIRPLSTPPPVWRPVASKYGLRRDIPHPCSGFGDPGRARRCCVPGDRFTAPAARRREGRIPRLGGSSGRTACR